VSTPELTPDADGQIDLVERGLVALFVPDTAKDFFEARQDAFGQVITIGYSATIRDRPGYVLLARNVGPVQQLVGGLVETQSRGRLRIPPPGDSDWIPHLMENGIGELPPEWRAFVAAPSKPVIGAVVADVARVSKPPVKAYATGISPVLDTMIGGGWSTRQLAVVLGPPGTGKSAFAVATAMHVQRARPVLYVSTELESDEITARIAGTLIGCKWTDIVRGKVPREQVAAAVAGLRITVVGCEMLPSVEPIKAIGAEIDALTFNTGVAPLLIVDYLQDLVRGSEDNVRGRIGEIARQLRMVAQAGDIPVIAVSSTSRAYYGAARQATLRASGEDASTYLAAAKESGDVDYAAAVVLYLDVEVEPQPDGTQLGRIAVAKSRHGSRGFVGVRFHGATGHWTADATALIAMSADARVERKQDARATANEDKLIAAIRKHPASAWRHVRTMSGISPLTEADAARDRLFAAGRIASVTEDYRDSLGRSAKRNVLRVIGDPPLPDSMTAVVAAMAAPVTPLAIPPPPAGLLDSLAPKYPTGGES